MDKDCLFSVDRIEGEVAVLVADTGDIRVVPLTDLSAAQAGETYRLVDGRFCKDADAEMARKEQVRLLQQRLRQPR